MVRSIMIKNDKQLIAEREKELKNMTDQSSYPKTVTVTDPKDVVYMIEATNYFFVIQAGKLDTCL